MDCETIESIGGKITCHIDSQFYYFLTDFLNTQQDTIVNFTNLIAAFFTLSVIFGLVVYAFRLPVAMQKIYEVIIVCLIAALTVNATFIFGMISFFDGIALGIAKAFFSIANPDIKINYIWDLFIGVDTLMKNSWDLTRMTWNSAHMFWGDVGWLDVGLALLLSIVVGVLYFTFSAFLLIAIAGKYIFAALFPFVVIASVLPFLRYMFTPYFKQLVSFSFLVTMLSLMMGITSAAVQNINDNTDNKIFGKDSLISQLDQLNEEYKNETLNSKSENSTESSSSREGFEEKKSANLIRIEGELSSLQKALKEDLKNIYSSSTFFTILLLCLISIFYHLKSSDWISLIIGSQAVQGMGGFITATAGMIAGAGAVAQKPQEVINSVSQDYSRASNPNAPYQTVGSKSIQSVRSIISRGNYY